MDIDGDEKQGVFDVCSFAIIRSSQLDDAAAEELANLLKLHDGEAIIDSYPDAPLPLEQLTHIISSTSDFPDYDAACDAMIPTVRPLWAQHCVAKGKLTNPRQYNPDPRFFMSDVAACCADLPEGDADAIAGGILAMGGLYASKLSNQITHIVALSMEAEQCDMAVRRNLNVKIVLPHWFDDCLRLGRKIDEYPYLLPNPEILQPPQDKAPTGVQRGQVTGALTPDPSASLPVIPSAIRSRQKVFKNKRIMLGKDLGIGSQLRGVLEDLIKDSKGDITNSVKRADIFICKYREGEDYRGAARAGKQVGNLAWLYYLLTTDTWTSPLKRLLHYPIARGGLEGFGKFRISLSNYNGEARAYLENLISALGAECTKTLKQDNTHLVTAHSKSEKCAAARDWGIHVVNHLWLEESYARWKLQSVTNSRYTHFPQRTNLGEVVGQTPIDRDVVERLFYRGEDIDMTDAPEEDEPTLYVNRNGAMDPTNDEDPTPNANKNVQSKSKKPIKVMSSSPPPRNSHTTPIIRRYLPTGKENITPSTTGSRRSKDVAAAKLENLTNDILLYEKERKRVGGVVYGGRKKNDEDRVQPARKRSIDEASDVEMTEENDAKKQRKGLPPAEMHLMVSSFKRWTGQPKVEDNDKKQLRSLGVLVTQDPTKASHLAAPHIVRTHKFVLALSYAPAVISTDFIEACLEQDELLDPDQFELQDKVNEKKLGFSLRLSRERAKENRHQLLQGRAVYCVENIHGGFETYKSIVEANGGQCMLWRNRKGTLVPSRRADSEVSMDDDGSNEVYLLSETTPENSKLWTRFRQMAEGSRKTPRIVTADWLLETAMCQKLLPVGNYEIPHAV